MKKFFSGRSVDHVGYLFVLPWIVGFLIFTAYPIFYSLYLSFFKVSVSNTGIKTVFAGLNNYIQAVSQDPNFISNVSTYLQNIFVSAILIVILSLLIAMMLNQKIRGIGIFRTIYFLPVIIVSGPVLQKLQTLGMTKVGGVSRTAASQVSTDIFGMIMTYVLNNIVILLWFTGVPILIFLATLQKQDTNVFEAASIDGAGAWETFWKITLPGLASIILVNMVYVIVTYSTSGMNPIITTIQNDMFAQGFGLGYSAAISWIYFVIVSLVLGIIAGVMALFARRNRR